MMVTHNTGQSASFLTCLAARKPTFALSTCRMMRALYLDPLGRKAIRWCADFKDLREWLLSVLIERVDPAIVALAAQDSWTKVGQTYAALYRRLAAAGVSA